MPINGYAHAPELVEKARRLYHGVGLGPEDTPKMGGAAIAEACGVHPHTIDAWIKRDGWQRPGWYSKGRQQRAIKSGQATVLLRAAIAASVAAGKPLPNNLELARSFGCTLQSVSAAFRALRRSGEVRTEQQGSKRRLILKDGTVTPWATARINQRPAPAPVESATAPRTARSESAEGSRPKLTSRDLVLRALTAAAANERACPTNEQLATSAGLSHKSIRKLLAGLELAGEIRIEHAAGNLRRIILADGRATAMPGGQRYRPGLDYAASDATRALQRMGKHVFDIAVVTGQAWGVCWSVDGRRMTRAELIAHAAERRSAAMQAMTGATA